ncbi:MAG: STAS domain-containing protein [Actinomycetes bacterium]
MSQTQHRSRRLGLPRRRSRVIACVWAGDQAGGRSPLLTVHRRARHVEVTVSGHVDTEAGMCLMHTLQDLIRRGETRCTVDLSGVRSCGLTGIAALVACHRYAHSRHGWVRVAHPSPQLQARLASAQTSAGSTTTAAESRHPDDQNDSAGVPAAGSAG